MLGVGVAGPLSPEDEAAPRSPARPTPAADERDAWAVLAGVRGLGPVGFGALLRRYGTGRAILEEAASPGGIERLAGTTLDEAMSAGERPPRSLAIELATAIADAGEHAGATLRRIEALGLRVVTIEDAAYPRRLAAVEMPPHVLYVLGEPAALGCQVGGGHRRDPPRHRCGSAHRRTDRRRPRGRRRERHLGPGGRYRRCCARGGGPRPMARPWPSSDPAMAISTRALTHGWRRPSSRPAARSCPSSDPTSHRAGGRSRAATGSSAGSRTRRSSSRRRPGAGRSSRRRGRSSRVASASSSRAPSGIRRRPGALPSCASSRRARASWPGSRS